MKKLINTFVFVVILGISQFSFGDDGGACKCSNTSSVHNQLNRTMQSIATEESISNGSVMVKYSIDQNNRMHIEEIQASSNELKDLVSNTLEGKKLKMNGEQCSQGYLHIKFVDQNNVQQVNGLTN